MKLEVAQKIAEVKKAGTGAKHGDHLPGVCIDCGGPTTKKEYRRCATCRARARLIPEKRFWSKVKMGNPDDCWLWMGKIERNGYGRFWFDSHFVGAHRFAYELTHGPIPKGLTIDHKCRNRACVNPLHLEPVSIQINVLRGVGLTAQFAAKTHCPQGHPYDMFNTYINRKGARVCRQCARQANRQYYQRRLQNGIRASNKVG